MSPEKAGHVLLKGELYRALYEALARFDRCQVLTDGATVSIGPDTDFEPDVVVQWGDPVAPDSLAVPNPLIVVEVVSPSSQRVDTTIKRDGYMSLPGLAHYLVFRTDRKEALHWTRQEPGPRVVLGGLLHLDPPGATIDLDGIYRRARLA
jgi:Uma2 family endonuclease